MPRDGRDTVSTVKKLSAPVSGKRSLSSAAIGKDGINNKRKRSSTNQSERRVTESENNNDGGGVSERQKNSTPVTMNANSNGGDNGSMVTLGRREAIAFQADMKTLISTVSNNNSEIKTSKNRIVY